MNTPPTFPDQCLQAGLPEPEREHRFHPVRRWRLDYAWPQIRLAIEIDGGSWIQGRHSRGPGVAKDNEKYAQAIALGWRILRVTPADISSGQALSWALEAMQWTTVPSSFVP